MLRWIASKAIMAYDVRTKYEIPSFLRLLLAYSILYSFQKGFTYTPNANMADLSVGPGLVARKRG